MVIAAIAVGALILGAWVSRLIKRRGDEATDDSGPGDPPGSPDRGPDGLRM